MLALHTTTTQRQPDQSSAAAVKSDAANRIESNRAVLVRFLCWLPVCVCVVSLT